MSTQTTRLVAMSLAGLLLVPTGFGALTNSANSCLSEAMRVAGYWKDAVISAYVDDDKTDDEFDDAAISNDAFTRGTDNTEDKNGMVYAVFGRDATTDGDYIVTAYLGKQCGVASYSKLYCELKIGTSQFSSTYGVPTIPTAIWADCHLCYDVNFNASQAEEVGPTQSTFKDNEVVTLVNALTDELQNANHHGVVVDATPRDWNTHTPTSECQTKVTLNP